MTKNGYKHFSHNFMTKFSYFIYSRSIHISRASGLRMFSRLSFPWLSDSHVLIVIIALSSLSDIHRISADDIIWSRRLLHFLFRLVGGISVFTKVVFPIAARPWYRDSQRRRSRVNYARYRSRPWRAECRGTHKDICVYYARSHRRPAERKISRKGKGGRTGTMMTSAGGGSSTGPADRVAGPRLLGKSINRGRMRVRSRSDRRGSRCTLERINDSFHDPSSCYLQKVCLGKWFHDVQPIRQRLLFFFNCRRQLY